MPTFHFSLLESATNHLKMNIFICACILFLCSLSEGRKLDTTDVWLRIANSPVYRIDPRGALLNSPGLNRSKQVDEMFACIREFPPQDLNTGDFPGCQPVLQLFNCLNSIFHPFRKWSRCCIKCNSHLCCQPYIMQREYFFGSRAKGNNFNITRNNFGLFN